METTATSLHQRRVGWLTRMAVAATAVVAAVATFSCPCSAQSVTVSPVAGFGGDFSDKSRFSLWERNTLTTFTDERPVTTDERRFSEDTARQESYRIMADAVLAWGPINRIRAMFDPFINPVQVYRDRSGGVTTGYFGESTAAAGAERLFNVRVELSARQNLNVWAEVYDSVTIGFLDGAAWDIRYHRRGGDFGLGLVRESGDKTYVAATFAF
jgi:hypothetical protein